VRAEKNDNSRRYELRQWSFRETFGFSRRRGAREKRTAKRSFATTLGQEEQLRSSTKNRFSRAEKILQAAQEVSRTDQRMRDRSRRRGSKGKRQNVPIFPARGYVIMRDLARSEIPIET
jgi:hypothetical protein